jgi:hypothetical protein
MWAWKKFFIDSLKNIKHKIMEENVLVKNRFTRNTRNVLCKII